MTVNRFSNNGLSYNDAIAITPSDSATLTYRPIAIIIDDGGTAGTIKMGFDSGNTLTINAVKGIEYKYSPNQIFDTGTTATSVKGLV